MRIKTHPQRHFAAHVIITGETVNINGKSFDFSRIKEGDTLEPSAIDSLYFLGNVERIDGVINLTLMNPLPAGFVSELAYPVDLGDIVNGVVSFPSAIGPETIIDEPIIEPGVGKIDWSKLVTTEMKLELIKEEQLNSQKSILSEYNSKSTKQIARIQDRIETLGYGIESGESDDSDIEEFELLSKSLTEWKSYKFKLGKVTTKESWPLNPEWPEIPEIGSEVENV